MALKIIKHETRLIPGELYKKIKESTVITCVDAIVITDKGVLLGRRKNPPVQGECWFCGGRQPRGVPATQAVIDIVRKETGLLVAIEGSYFPLVGDTIFTVGENRHSLNTTFVVTAVGGRAELNGDLEEIRLVKSIEPDLHPYIKEMLSKSAVFGNRQIPGVVRYDESDAQVALAQMSRQARRNS
ncbi:MAG: hypothetical protein M1321_02635 [Candidatus Marsarchaeota archaeon]|nr:hypothetical protein [Candidatus Marsarchaeota archaeon]